MRMRILVQNCVTCAYLVSPDKWSDDAEAARTFPTSESAIAYCAEHQVSHAQIVLKFDDDYATKYDITVPLSKECKEAAAAEG